MSFDNGKVPAGAYGVGTLGQDIRNAERQRAMPNAAMNSTPLKPPTIGEYLDQRESMLMAAIERVQRARKAYTAEGLQMPVSFLHEVG